MSKDSTIGSSSPTIVIIGKGNVGSHLTKAFSDVGLNVRNVSARGDNYTLDDADYIIIAVKDDFIPKVIRSVSEKIMDKSRPSAVMHTSGSVPMSVIADNLTESIASGVFYPMQTFTSNVEMRYDNIPILIEATDKSTLLNIKNLASKISRNVIEADSDVRAAYHIGAVFACNFSNHLCALASDFLASRGLQFSNLLPLLEQTFNKLRTTPPREVQTGPAVRGDEKVINYHLENIRSTPHLYQIYSLLSKSIRESSLKD